jgi:hypothetical protein
MNTLQSINTRKFLLVPVFAAFAAYTHIDSSRPATIGAPSRVADIQESTRQILLGRTNSNAGAPVVVSGSTATLSAGSSASNQHGGGDVQRQTQRVVLGRAAS